MKKLLVATLLFFIPLMAVSSDFAIDERKSDIYFANSVLTTKDQARYYLDIIWEQTLSSQYNNDIAKMKKMLNFDISYNQTHGYVGDLYDTYMMLSSEEDGWKTLNNIMGFLLDKGVGKVIKKAPKLSKHEKDLADKIWGVAKQGIDLYGDVRKRDLSVQVEKYRYSIRQGHSVIVVAHGKGDIFTAKAYKDMLKPDKFEGVAYEQNSWMEEFFSWISVGSPTRERLEGHPHVGFDNDRLAYVSTLSTIKNPNRSQFTNAVNEVIDETSIKFHRFEYYMGNPIVIESGNRDTKVSTSKAKSIILNFIKDMVEKHRKQQTQWAVDKELHKGTKDFRVTVKHLYDQQLTNLIKDEIVFPFAPNKKLYQVPDTTGTLHYVKGSVGGEEILSADDADRWEAKENQFYKLEGTDPVEYIEANKSKKSFILKTGQTKSYAKYDDGYYRMGEPRSYTRDDAKEVVIDNTTGLVWQDDEDAKTGTKTWEDAKAYCQALTLGGYSDWRLPTIRELKTIVDRGRSYPAIDPTFQNVVSAGYWSSTTNASGTDYAWGINFYYDYDYRGYKSITDYVRCVRSADN